VPTHIELLTTLQSLDQRISQKIRDAEEAARQRRALEEATELHAADVGRCRAELAEAATRQRALEGQISEFEDKMKDRRMRLQRIRNEKEMQATRREIETLKERTTQLEDEALKVLEEVETLGAKVAAAEQQLDSGQRALAAERDGLLTREAELVADAERERGSRAALIAAIDGGLVRRYELIFARRGGTAVVAVKDGTCQGCHMNVPPQLVNQILRGHEVFACPSCQRLLFPETGNAPEA
jgi:hypothetical protein